MVESFRLSIKNFFEETGDAFFFFKAFVRNIFRGGFEWNEFLKQCYLVGVKSLNIVLLTGFVLGFVLTLQSLPTLKEFGAESWVPDMVAISVIREIGPVIIALICAGKIASGIGAELGSMKVTEQVDAMEVSGANPMKYLVATRILACTLMVPLLVLFADGMSFIGGFIGMNVAGEMTATLYFNKSFINLLFSDLFPAIIKTVLFGFCIGFIGCYKGYKANKGTESVGVAANSAVVASCVAIIIIDAIAVQITSFFVYN